VLLANGEQASVIRSPGDEAVKYKGKFSAAGSGFVAKYDLCQNWVRKGGRYNRRAIPRNGIP
jgi:hypothetical protein